MTNTAALDVGLARFPNVVATAKQKPNGWASGGAMLIQPIWFGMCNIESGNQSDPAEQHQGSP